MAKGLREKDRSDYYIKGQLTGDGIVVPYSTDKIKYPSPGWFIHLYYSFRISLFRIFLYFFISQYLYKIGQYEPPMNVSYHLRNDLTRSKSVGRSSSMGTSPRMAPLSSTLKKNVLFTPSVSDSLRLSYRGPGSYFHSDDNFSISSSNTSPLRRKSFNVRVQSGNSIGRQHAQKYLSLDQQQQQQTNNLTSPIKLPNSKRNTVKKAWSADEITNPSTPSRGNRTPSHYTQYPMSQIHTPIDLSTNRFTPYHHSYEYNGIRTPKH